MISSRPSAPTDRKPSPADRLVRGLAEVAADLAELVLPAQCAGCGAQRVPLRYGTCAGCVAALEELRAFPAAPVPVPPGMPACVALGRYADVLREVLLSYKERGRHRLAAPLGALLAGAVVAAAGAPGPRRVPLVLVPVPSTGAAARQRHGDHMARLAAHCVRRLRTAGWQVRVVNPLQALPRADSTALDRAGRVAAAHASWRVRPRRAASLRRALAEEGAVLLVIDDIVTTGATLAAVADRLRSVDVPVRAAAVLAATVRRGPPPLG